MRGTGIDRWGSSGNIGQGATQATLYGQQINLLTGLTYRARPDFLVGVVGGYENFSYTETRHQRKAEGRRLDRRRLSRLEDHPDAALRRGGDLFRHRL